MTELEKLKAGLEYCYDDDEVDALKEQAILWCREQWSRRIYPITASWEASRRRKSRTSKTMSLISCCVSKSRCRWGVSPFRAGCISHHTLHPLLGAPKCE